MITQTLALFLDAYRDLNSRKLFWITMTLSALCVGAFALLGVSDRGLTLLSLEFDVPMPRFVYNWVFSFFVIGIWLSWGAVLLALVSTAGIFPDLIAGGSIDAYLSKPISRLRLFLTKYLTGLVFVLLQATVFAAAAYLVMGLRAGRWMAGMWLLVPLVVCIFSYLFAVCVILGVLTRSTVASILVTVLLWLFLFLAAKSEQGLLTFVLINEHQAKALERRAARLEEDARAADARDSVADSFGLRAALLRGRRDNLRKEAAEAEATARKMRTAHSIVLGFVTVLPKPGPTIDLFDRRLFTEEELSEVNENQEPPPPLTPGGRDADSQEAAREAFREAGDELQDVVRARSPAWVIGTSLAFEAAVVALAAWVFCRRDY